MGIYDREYYRDEPRGIFIGGDRSMTTNLVILNVIIWFVDLFAQRGSVHLVSNFLAVRVDTPWHPLEWWRFLTYGFVHSPGDIWHVGWNMFALWLFGRDVEHIYGRREFLRFYLVGIVLASVAWCGVSTAQGLPPFLPMIGASGGVAAVLILFIHHFPRQTILLFFIIPVPAWILGVFIVTMDALGAAGMRGGNVAFVAHLAGAAWGLLYYRSRMNLGSWIPAWLSFEGVGKRLKRIRGNQPRLRIHDPEQDELNLSAEVDRILEKISREGEDSLTRAERKTLENASRRYQQRRNTE